jgi:hypothetical protein
MQVYAAALVYNALRVAQSEGAAQVGVAPETISPAKFYPKVVTATFLYLHEQQWSVSGASGSRGTISVGSRDGAAGVGLRSVLCRWNAATSTGVAVGSVPRAVSGSRSRMSVAVADSSSELS